MAERKAKEYAIDAAFTKYLADEQKKQEEKERLKERTRREKSIYVRSTCIEFTTHFFIFSCSVWKRIASDYRAK